MLRDRSTGEDTDVVIPFELANLLGGFDTIHNGKLNIHLR